MKLRKAAITILVEQEYTIIRLHDEDSGVEFCEATLTPKQLSSALSRLSCTPCEIEVHGLDKLGKTHECKPFEFELSGRIAYDNQKKIAVEQCKKALVEQGMTEWVPDSHFSSRNSFFTKDGKNYARTTIRRWV
jgi:hypothetical protein